MLRDLNSYIKLSDGSDSHFRYKEFIKSATASRLGIDNTPTENHWRSIELLVEHVLEPVRLKFGPIRITSGYRSVKLCEAVGSNKNSNHARGEAADIEPISDIPLMKIVEWISANLNYRELISEYFPDGWVHIAYRKNGNDKINKLKDKNHNYSRVSIDYIKDIYGV